MANRVVLGAFDNDYVLRVSRPGYNVLDPNLSAKQLAFDSRWSQFTTIHSEGVVRFAPHQRYLTIAHDLGYRPYAMSWYMPSQTYLTAFDVNAYWIEVHSFTDHIELESPPIYNAEGTVTSRDYEFWVKYAIMRMSPDG